ncbi:hypothetical protein DPMN_017493 [Dreissena polymorpha]|uniref:Uncharacterized protein n=1 Tax=Dreissena polymorpha TaxID=45954 RepID=A0A9D4NET0_DREPO|nr:hypothetical protein DPMN_017493 [Dreissena polymorpha]
MNNKWPLGSHVFLTDLNHFLARLFSEKTRAIVIASSLSAKNAPLLGGHVFSLITTIFTLVRDIHITNAKYVTSTVKKTPPGSHVFLPIQTIIELNVRSPSLTQMNRSQDGYKKNAPPIGSHVFQAKVTIFELIQDVIGTNHLSKFHEDWNINVASRENAPPPGGHFYEDQTINVASRVKNTPPLGSHVFQANITILKLIQDIIETNLLTKFYEDWTINVASRE